MIGRRAEDLRGRRQRQAERHEQRADGHAAGHGLGQAPSEEGVDQESDERNEDDEREHRRLSPYHLREVKASGVSVSRCRNRAMTIARPTAASAAATVITKNVMIWPSTDPL